MNTKHTPGEWIAKDGQIYPIETGKTLAIIPYYITDDEQQANARLIAAAPDLLEALRQFIHSTEHEGVIHGRIVDAVRNAEAAILKATTPTNHKQ